MTASETIRGIAFAGDLVQDEAATFSTLVERQARFVFRVAFAIVRNRQDAEDVVQETFLKLHRGKRWLEMRDERAFLARAAWRIAVDHRRAKPENGAITDYPAPAACPERSAIASENAAVVQRLIDTLPEELRHPLVLSGIEDLNSRQIAEVLNTTESAVRARIARARQILKQKMANGYGL